MKGHGQGLPAFTALESLKCQNSCILADDAEAELSSELGTESFFQVPADLSTLTQLNIDY